MNQPGGKRQRKSSLERSRGGAGSVLIVDDIEVLRQAVREVLEPAGFRIAGEAADGRQALAQYRRLKPDLVVLDITMPEMDGISVLRRLRRRDPSCRVLMCSALSDQPMILRAIRLGAADYVVKPFQEDRLRTAALKAVGASDKPPDRGHRRGRDGHGG